MPLSFAMSFPPCVPPTFTVGERYIWSVSIDGETNPEWEVGFRLIAPPQANLRRAA